MSISATEFLKNRLLCLDALLVLISCSQVALVTSSHPSINPPQRVHIQYWLLLLFSEPRLTPFAPHQHRAGCVSGPVVALTVTEQVVPEHRRALEEEEEEEEEELEEPNDAIWIQS